MKILDQRNPTEWEIPAGRVWEGESFEFEGHRYMRIRPDSLHTTLVREDGERIERAKLIVTDGMIVAANLKSGTIRGIDAIKLVRLLDVELIIRGFRKREEAPPPEEAQSEVES